MRCSTSPIASIGTLSQALQIFAIKSQLEEERDLYRARREMREFLGPGRSDPGASDA